MNDLRRVGPRLLVDRERVTGVVGDPSDKGGPTIIYVQEGNGNNTYTTPWSFLEVYATLQDYDQGS